MDPLEASEMEMALLRDAFVSEGFISDFSRRGDQTLCFEVGKRGNTPIFQVVFQTSRNGSVCHIVDKDGLATGVLYESLREAVSQGCNDFNVLPSWEMEQFPLIWKHLMDEDD